MGKTDHWIKRSTLVVLIAAVAALVWWALEGKAFIEAATSGLAPEAINKYLQLHRRLDPDNRNLAYYLDHGMGVGYRLFGSWILLSLGVLVAYERLRQELGRFFEARSSPIDLAVFRVVLFGAFFFYINVSEIVRFSQLPDSLLVPPLGLGWMAGLFTLGPDVTLVAGRLLQLSCLAALLGVWTRYTTLLTVILGFLVLGLPQFYGKINHFHHLLWFGALLAASPCADVFSLDAYLKRRYKGHNPHNTPGRRYAIPLRYVWLLIGVIYFFAGYWKFIIGGMDWILGDTFRDVLHAQWFRLNWVPPFRVDESPFLLAGGGVGVILFELAFIFMLFRTKTRLIAILIGLSFHLMVFFLTQINFWTLAVCYVAFIPFGQIGAYLRRTRSYLSKPEATVQKIEGMAPWSKRVGGVLLAVNLVCGFLLIDTWPVAVYPTFAGVSEPYMASITLVVETEDVTHEIIPWRIDALKEAYGTSRLLGFMWQIQMAPSEALKRARARAVADVFKPYLPVLQQDGAMSVAEDVFIVDPAHWGQGPLRRTFIVEAR